MNILNNNSVLERGHEADMKPVVRLEYIRRSIGSQRTVLIDGQECIATLIGRIEGIRWAPELLDGLT